MKLLKVLATATLAILYTMPSISQTNSIRVNQIGYYANNNKLAFIANKQAQSFDIKDAKPTLLCILIH